EPQEGKLDSTDLDKYVDWCAQNSVRPEFRFLAGYQPQWVKSKVANDQKDLILRHAKDLAQRYGNKIADWQITSEDIGLKEIGMMEYDPKNKAAKVTSFFADLRKILPNAHLGISDDARFFSPRLGPAATDDMQRGLKTLHDLKQMGVTVDYFALEAKHPLGLWAGGKQIYETLDAFAKEGVRIHITEFGVAVGDRIEGSVREGTWTPQTQAEYYERFFTLCFSHPNVDAINVMGMGPHTWLDGQGLLDDKYDPTPAFTRLKELITQRWRTNITDKLAANGIVLFRGFQGGYNLEVTMPDGKIVTTKFDVVPLNPDAEVTSVNNYRFTLDHAAGSLTPAPSGGH
ncbi:MAG TPA: endo-1,4-beta-xylanase, partial [Phycisphaerae bacterium]